MLTYPACDCATIQTRAAGVITHERNNPSAYSRLLQLRERRNRRTTVRTIFTAPACVWDAPLEKTPQPGTRTRTVPHISETPRHRLPGLIAGEDAMQARQRRLSSSTLLSPPALPECGDALGAASTQLLATAVAPEQFFSAQDRSYTERGEVAL